MADSVPQQAHHIIPVAVFNGLQDKFEKIFGEDYGSSFQQMGGNFIYLNTTADGAAKTQNLLTSTPGLFGDVAVGGAQHWGSHGSYNAVVTSRLERIFESSYDIDQKQMMVLDLQRGLKEILIDGAPNVMQAAQFDAASMDAALNRKGVYSPDNINSTTKATQLLDDFNADNGNFLTRTFGTSGTEGIAKYTGEMIYDNMNHLDEITGFLSDGSRTSFDNYVPADAGSARQIIYRSTYDVEKYLSAANITPNLKSASLDSFYAEFKEAVSLSMSDGANSARLTQLTNSLETRALDAKAAKLLSDLKAAVNNPNKVVHLDLDNFENVNAKNSALWDVLNHIGESSQFDNIKINGQLVSDYKKVVIDVDGKDYKPFTEAVFYDAVLKTEVVKAKNGGVFDEDLFKSLDISTVNIETEIEAVGGKLDNAIDKFQNNVRFVDTSLFGKALKKLPLVGLLLGASMTANAAEGKSEAEQTDIWAEFASGEAAAEVAGIAASLLTGAVLVAIGVATGPVAIVAGLAVGIAAGIYGDQAGRDLYQLTKDLDGDGKADIFDEIGTLLFGKNIDQAQIPELIKTNTSLIDANITDEQLATLAKNDLAYRYALLKLNPFVITDIDYSQFNENGELELYSAAHPDGMTDEYIEKRAEMLEAKIQELTTGTSNGEHSYRDIATEQDILSKYTDAGSGNNGIGAYRSEVIFAADDGQTITSLDYGNTNDFLFGGKGDDTFDSGEGDDYLEGNKGKDTLIGGNGDDTLFGGTGNDTLHGDSEDENDGYIFGFLETKGNDILIGGTGGDTIYGGRGKDTIILAEGNKDDSRAVLEEKSKIDTEHNVAFGGEGNDTIYGSDGKDNIITGTQEDEDSDENTINYGYGFGGDDALIGRAGVDYLYGGDDKDTIWGGKGNDVLEGGAGVDTLYGEDGHDVLVGNAGDDNLYGGAGGDVLMGDIGYDTYNYNNDENKGQKSYVDQIYDIDGKGKIVIDGKKLVMGKKISSNTWLSEDENYYITRYQKSVLSSDWLEGSNDTFKSMYNPNESRPYLLNISSAKHYQSVHKVWFWKDGDLDLKLTEKEPEPKPDPIPPPPPPPPPPRDPLSLDLDNDGVISTLSLANGVYFDLDNSGFAEKTAWIGQKDGLLVLDKNDNQRIDGGAELFGTETFLQDGTLAENGYLALGEYDTDGDGQITQADATYSKLKVWQDKNSNGVAESDELKTLSELNIESINTDYALNTTTDNNGVEHREDSVFTYIDGKSGITNTLWFDSNRVDSINVDIHHGSQIELDQHIQELPDIDGFGNVYSLHQAMQADTTGHLADLVSHFAAESDADIRQELITDIISHWSGQQNIDPSGLGSGINAQTVSIMQGFWGESDTDGVTRAEYVGIELRYEQFSGFVYTQLMKQTHDAFLYNQIEFSENDEGIVADYTQLSNFIVNTLQLVLNDKDSGEINLEVYDRVVSLVTGINPYDTTNRYLQDFNNTLDQTMQERFGENEYQFLKCALDKGYSFFGTSDADNIEIPIDTELSNVLLLGGNDIAQGGAGADVIYGEAGNDDLSGGAGDDNLIGGIGDDRLNGESGNDILDGGKGIDIMIGGAGNDTYYIENIEDQVIEEADEGIDTIISTHDYDLKNTSVENLTLTDNAITGIGNDSENILLANSRNNVLDGGKGSDTMVGGAGNDTYYVDDVNDRIVENSNEGTDLVKTTASYTLSNNIENLEMLEGATNATGNGLDNRILGNDKDNTLTGKFGDDIYIGGKGDDVIIDNGGNNIITLAKGDGNDTIVLTTQESRAYSTSEYKDGFIWNYNKFAKVSNEIVFSDIQRGEVSFSLSEKNSIANNNLIIKYGDNDSITIADFLENPELTKITYSDGSFDSLEDIYNELTIELLGTDQEDDMAGHDSIKNIIHGQAGDDTITGGENIDKIYGDEGDDSIVISDNDFAYGGLGNDNLSVNESVKAYLDGGLGYDSYNLGNSIGTRIVDADFSGVINVDGNVTHIGYFENKVWDSGHGSFASRVPGLHNTELVSEIKTGEWTTEYKLKYTADTTRISEFVFDTTNNSFVHHKLGTSYKTNFSQYTDGFDYFGFENTVNYSDINNLRELDVLISGNSYQYKNLRDTNDYTVVSTLISMDDFINQGSVRALYTDSDDIIEGLSSHQSFSFVSNKTTEERLDVLTQEFKNYYDNNLEVPENFESANLSGIITGDIIVAKAGDDKINTGKGSSIVLAGSGNDYIIAPDNEAINLIYGHSGNDTIYMYDPTDTYTVDNPRKYADNRDVVFGGEGNDSIFFDESNNSISKVYGGEGNDYIESLGHLGYVEGGEGNDIIRVQGNSDINAGSGDDEIIVGSGNVVAGSGDDKITALDGGVTMNGESGADTLIGGLGDDTFIVDEYDTYTEEGIDLEGGYDTIHIESDFDLSQNNFEAVTLLGSDNFNVLGDQFDNVIHGNEGDNFIDGKAGADTMSGGTGDDYYVIDRYETLITDDDGIILQYGDQVVEGTLSRDGFVQGDSGGNDTVEQWDDHRFYRQDDMGNWSNTGSYHHLQNNIENLILKGDAKTAFGNELDNVITLNEQSNFVNGLGGNDTIIYQKGGGQDTISVTDNVEAIDTLVIQGYSQEQSSFTREQDSLMIRFAGSDEHIWIADYFKAAETAIPDEAIENDEIIFDDPLLGNLPIDDQPISIIDNKIDRIIFENNGSEVILTQQDIDAAIIDRADNHAPIVNKYPKAITINDDDSLNVQFDADTIVDQDAWDSILSYRITLADQNADGSYQDIPDWLSFDADTLTLTGDPTVDSIGNYSFILWAGDLFGTSAGAYLTLTINSSQPIDTPVETTPDNIVEGTDSSEQLSGTTGNDIINGYLGDDQLFGFTGNDTLNGGAGDDYLAGGNGSGSNSGNDILNGGAGNDTLSGEDGNDTLSGGAGNDSYIYKANQGIDTIDNSGGGNDGIFFQGIDKSQLSYHQEGDDLIILVDGDLNQQVKVEGHFSSNDKAIDYIVPSSNMVVSAQSIASQLTALPGSGSGDTDNGGNDDTTTPTDPEVPTDNTDLSGDNTIVDTAGNDQLKGGRGNDTYIYTAGIDTIIDTHGVDEIIFSNGITYNQVGSGLMSSGNDLILRVNGDINNQVTIKDYFSNGDSIIETISFETGGSISHEQIFGLFGKAIPETTSIDDTVPSTPDSLDATADIVGTDANEQLQGAEVDNRLQGLLGDDQLDGGLGNDILIGGLGNDLLKGGEGDDLYYFEAGFGQDTIDNTGGGIDNIYFDGVGFNDIASGLMRSNDDLILKVSGTTDQLTIADFFEGGESAVGNISFASGGSISADQIFGAYSISNPNPTNVSSSQHQSTLGTMLNMMQQFEENSMNNGYGDVI